MNLKMQVACLWHTNMIDESRREPEFKWVNREQMNLQEGVKDGDFGWQLDVGSVYCFNSESNTWVFVRHLHDDEKE